MDKSIECECGNTLFWFFGSFFRCNKCEVVMYSMHQDSYMTDNRTFDNSDDQPAVFKKLVESGKWGKFYNNTENYDAEPLDLNLEVDDAEACYSSDYALWLFINPERFCKLVSDYIKEEGK